ncbi:MAG: hypothetical protein KAH21_01635, partial [Spirochaetaceae bacterium]|nr:hypothetical protein [Spirochaetaceae bacterium]
GAVFWFGWIQFSLGEGDYAVIYTKTNGYESTTLKNGEFTWRWQALLPTNLTLHIFNLENRSYSVKKSGTLPSGDFYAQITGEDIHFDWDIEVKILYHLDSEALSSMVSEGLQASELDTYYSNYESKMNSELIRLIAEEVDTDPEETIGSRIDRMENSLKVKAANLDKRFVVVDTMVQDWTYPDLTLYSEARRLTLDLMDKRKIVISELENSAVRREEALGSRLNLLEEYGRILQEYPVLLDLFTIEGNPGASLLPPEEL